LAVVLVPNC